MEIGIVIQGPLHDKRNVDILIEKYSMYKDNCVISTWNDQPTDFINILKENGFDVLLNDRTKVAYVGGTNCNLQFYSTTSGINHLNNKYTHILKIRTDTIPSDVKAFIEVVSNKSSNKLVFLHCHPTGYFIDLFTFGPRDKVKKLWNIYQNETEKLTTERFLMMKDMGLTNPNIEHIKEKYDFCFKDLYENRIQLNWEKPDYRKRGDYVTEIHIHHNY